MARISIFPLPSVLLLLILLVGNSSGKTGKFLFNLINFPNDACKSSSEQVGTCRTGAECSKSGGTSDGSCHIFGVCCVAKQKTCGTSFSANNTYVEVTPISGVPCVVKIKKTSPSICQIKLAMEKNTLKAPATPLLKKGLSICADHLVVTDGNGVAQPQICGQNDGQHMYVSAGATDTSETTLTFTVADLTGTKIKILVSQIECTSPMLPPPGCLQYFTEPAGEVNSFNFISAGPDTNNPVPGQLIHNMDYSICVRTNAGKCSIEWAEVDATVEKQAFLMSVRDWTDAAIKTAGQDLSAGPLQGETLCSSEGYITILGGSSPSSRTALQDFTETSALIPDIFVGNDLHLEINDDITDVLELDEEGSEFASFDKEGSGATSSSPFTTTIINKKTTNPPLTDGLAIIEKLKLTDTDIFIVDNANNEDDVEGSADIFRNLENMNIEGMEINPDATSRSRKRRQTTTQLDGHVGPQNRYCGYHLNGKSQNLVSGSSASFSDSNIKEAITSHEIPFALHVRTVDSQYEQTKATADTLTRAVTQRGFKLKYIQMPC